MKNLEKYCEYLYDYIYIPIYIYKDQKLINCFPTQQESYYPPAHYIDRLWESNRKVSYITTNQYTHFGLIHLHDNAHSIVLGPVSSMPFNKEILSEMRKEYIIDFDYQEDFFSFFRNIPPQNQVVFFNLLLFIHYSLNDTQLNKNELLELDNIMLNTSIKAKHTKEIYHSKEHGTTQDSYLIEDELVEYIKTGNLSGLEEFAKRAISTKVGVIAHDNLRQLKNMFIVTVTLVSRAAIKGGLPPSIAYSLSNVYIQQVERLNDSDTIVSLLYQVQHDFCSRVANLYINPMSNDILYKVINYVHKHTNTDLKVEKIAKEIGYSRTHLSRKFTKELGFSLSTFIRRCKLEESKNLLIYTNKSISQISSYLCFSSQSHFQKAFKKQYGLTPYKYRKNNFSIHQSAISSKPKYYK